MNFLNYYWSSFTKWAGQSKDVVQSQTATRQARRYMGENSNAYKNWGNLLDTDIVQKVDNQCKLAPKKEPNCCAKSKINSTHSRCVKSSSKIRKTSLSTHMMLTRAQNTQKSTENFVQPNASIRFKMAKQKPLRPMKIKIAKHKPSEPRAFEEPCSQTLQTGLHSQTIRLLPPATTSRVNTPLDQTTTVLHHLMKTIRKNSIGLYRIKRLNTAPKVLPPNAKPSWNLIEQKFVKASAQFQWLGRLLHTHYCRCGPVLVNPYTATFMNITQHNKCQKDQHLKKICSNYGKAAMSLCELGVLLRACNISNGLAVLGKPKMDQ